MGASDKRSDETAPATPTTPTVLTKPNPKSKTDPTIKPDPDQPNDPNNDKPQNMTATAKAQARAQDALVYSQRQFDRVVLPETRQRAYDRTSGFATSRPLISSFIAVHLIFALLPLFAFISFAVFSSFVAGFLVCAWLCLVGTLILCPILFFGAVAATFAWLWLQAAYFVLQRLRPYIPESLSVLKFQPGGDIAIKGPDGKEVLFSRGGLGVFSGGGGDADGKGHYNPFKATEGLADEAREGAAEVRE